MVNTLICVCTTHVSPPPNDYAVVKSVFDREFISSPESVEIHVINDISTAALHKLQTDFPGVLIKHVNLEAENIWRYALAENGHFSRYFFIRDV